MCMYMNAQIYIQHGESFCCFRGLGLTTLYKINDKQAHPRKGIILPLYFSTVIVHSPGVGPSEIFHTRFRLSIHDVMALDYAIIFSRD